MMKRQTSRTKRRTRGKVGRPTKLTPVRQQEFCELLHKGYSRSRAAQIMGWTPSMVSKALRRLRGFAALVAQTERAIERQRLTVMRILSNGREREGIDSLRQMRRNKIAPSASDRRQTERLTQVLAEFLVAHLDQDAFDA